MKNVYSLAGPVLASLLFLCSFVANANSAEEDDIIINAKEQFVIQYFNQPDVTNITIALKYEKKEKSYTLSINPETDNLEIKLVEPLNLAFFKNAFNDKLDQITKKGFSVSQSSADRLFNWMLDVTNVLTKTPLSGRLLLNTHVMVIVEKDLHARDEGKNYDLRAEELAKELGDLWQKTNQKRLLFQSLSTYFSQNAHKKIPDLDFSKTMTEADITVDKYFAGKPAKIKPPIWDDEIWNNLNAYRTVFGQLQSKQDTLVSKKIFPIKKVAIQIERGFLERIQVWVADQNGQEMIYDNIYAIGFSSVKNFKFFQKIHLFPRYGQNSFIHLSDVFSNYNNYLDNYTRDYSPADTTINDISPDNGSVINLERVKYVNLFDSKIYTDFNGVNQNSPNGLVQIEASRKFNLKTSRQQFLDFRSDVGFFTYLNAYGSYNKIEKDQKYLRLKNENVAQNGVLTSPSYATNLDFRRWENFSLGAELNTFLFDWPDGKITAFLDFGGKYGHTPVTDYVREINGNVAINTKDTITRDAHTFTWYPKVSVEVFAEKKVGLILTYQFNNTLLFSNNDFKQIKSYTKSDLFAIPIERSARKSHMVEFYLRAETSQDRNGRMFLRARFFLQHRDINTFFPQFQVGYAYNLVFKK